MESDKEKVHNVNTHMFAVCAAMFMVVVCVICGFLVFMLYERSDQLLSERNKVIEQNEQIFDLRRSLDRAEGRLGVYEDFLVNNQTSSLKRIIEVYLRKKKTTPIDSNLADFTSWIDSQRVSGSWKIGIGGP